MQGDSTAWKWIEADRFARMVSAIFVVLVLLYTLAPSSPIGSGTRSR